MKKKKHCKSVQVISNNLCFIALVLKLNPEHKQVSKRILSYFFDKKPDINPDTKAETERQRRRYVYNEVSHFKNYQFVM